MNGASAPFLLETIMLFFWLIFGAINGIHSWNTAYCVEDFLTHTLAGLILGPIWTFIIASEWAWEKFK